MNRYLLVADAVRDAGGVLGKYVLIEAGNILAVGDQPPSSQATTIRYDGATVVPGLRDAHLHPLGYAAALQMPSFKHAVDHSEVADVVADAARSLSPGAALTGLRLDDESLHEGVLPDRHQLDRAGGGRPVLLMRYCGHIAVASTAALAAAGIGMDTEDPPGGVIDRDAGGYPTGVLRETAIEPVTAALRPLAPALTTDQIAGALTALAATGLTSVGAMVATGPGLWGGADSELEALLSVAADAPLGLTAFVIAANPADLDAAAARIDAVGARFGGVKMFSDGSLGGHTAAMQAPYADLPKAVGTDRLDPRWAEEMARSSLDLGGRVAVHAIGDRANGAVLDLMESLIGGGADPALLRIEHASVLADDDIRRFGDLGVTASVQPAFIASETGWLEKRLGSDRLRRTYPFRSLGQVGTPLAGGSDSPVEPPHPLLGMAAARDRLGIIPEESLSAEAAFHLFTAGAAAAIGETAAIQPGSPATFTILDTDPVTSDPNELRSARVLETWFEGIRNPVTGDEVTWIG